MTQSKIKDLTGIRFCRLLVVELDNLTTNQKTASWKCQCDCGNTCVVSARNLIYKNTKSCGCLAKESQLNSSTIHGHARKGKITPEFYSWLSIRVRCLKEDYSERHLYSGRGIKICDRWLNSFENFFEDMGKRPTPQHSIDRYPDNDGNYEPLNCRWATDKEQARNRRSNLIIEFKGETKLACEWAEQYGLSQQIFYKRRKRGWSIEKALTTPNKRI